MDLMAIKGRIHKVLYPLAPNISPTLVSILSVPLAFIGALVYAGGARIGGALIYLFSQLLDILDGTIAEKYGRSSSRGAAVDRVIDRINDAIGILAISVVARKLLLGAITLAFVIIASYMSSVYESFTKSKKGEGVSKRWLRLSIVILAMLVGFETYALYLLLAIAIFEIYERSHLIASLR